MYILDFLNGQNIIHTKSSTLTKWTRLSFYAQVDMMHIAGSLAHFIPSSSSQPFIVKISWWIHEHGLVIKKLMMISMSRHAHFHVLLVDRTNDIQSEYKFIHATEWKEYVRVERWSSRCFFLICGIFVRWNLIFAF